METPEVEPRSVGKKNKKIGKRIDVWEDRAIQTSGGLKKCDLIWNERTGKLCTVKEMARGKKMSEVMKGEAVEVAKE
jgi:hypothetical protein